MAKGPKYDSQQIAAAGTAANNANALYNTGLANANYYGPQGSVTTAFTGYDTVIDPTTGKATQVPRTSHTVTPSAEEMALYNTGLQTRGGAAQTAANQMGAAGAALSKPYQQQGPDWQYYDPAGFQNAYQVPLDQEGMIAALTQSYNRAQDPKDAAARTKLAVQGAGDGTVQSYRQTQAENDARGEFQRQAASQAETMANERLRLRNEALQGDTENRWKQQSQWNDTKGMANQAAMDERNQWINEIASLFNLGQWEFPSDPGYTGAQSQPVDVAGLMSKENEQRQAAKNEMMKGIFGIGGQALKLAFA